MRLQRTVRAMLASCFWAPTFIVCVSTSVMADEGVQIATPQRKAVSPLSSPKPINPPQTNPLVETLASEDLLMRAKLACSQNVMEGLLSEDFELIAEGARKMKKISEAAEWPRARDAVYEHLSAEFRRQCSKLEHLAKTENHEGLSFTYMQMMTTCIDCHNHVRKSLRVARTPEERGGGVQLIPSHWPENK